MVSEDSFLLDSINSYVQDRNDFSKCYFDTHSFSIRDFDINPNECCENNPNGCIYASTPGELRANFVGDILCGNDPIKFKLQTNFQTVEDESCEC